MVSLDEMADRPPRPLANGETIELGSMRVRHIDTPHVPHAWEARVLYDEMTGTLLCGDLFTHLGDGPALTEDDIIGPAGDAEDLFSYVMPVAVHADDNPTGSRGSRRARSPSCTARRSPATAPQCSARSPTPTANASPPPTA